MIGGGRWARVYAGVLTKHPDLVRSVTIVSPRNAEGMRSWAAAEGLPHEVTADADPPAFDAAIVANAASDHETWAHRFLDARVPVLVEKPFALGAAGAERLIALAEARGAYLAAALVFKFARYLDRFAALLPQRSEIRAVSLTWSDAAGEIRYGERKSHDVTLSVAADVLPHVASILDTLCPHAPIVCRSVAMGAGGSQADVALSLGGRPCIIRLARDAECRKRLIAVESAAQNLTLDFTVEPGIITRNGEAWSGDPDWGKSLSPLNRLVRAFLGAVAGQVRDERLDARLGLLACRVVDQALALG